MATEQPKVSKAFNGIPETWEEWVRAAKKLQVSRKSIHSRKEIASGSKISQEEYLLLKAIWETNEDTDISGLALGSHLASARQSLGQNLPFQAFIRGIRDVAAGNRPNVSEMGIFQIPFTQMQEVLHLSNLSAPKRPGKSDPKAKRETRLRHQINEDIVNTAAISLLTAITVGSVEGAVWSPHRAPLYANFKRASMEAQIDGYLSVGLLSQTSLILEAKARKRAAHEPAVSMQETAEMVAWLMAKPPSDGPEWYITEGKYTPEYREHILGERRTLAKDNFLVMKRFGPWRSDRPYKIQELCEVVFALVQRAVAEER
ncbi:hypothetical protein ASPZODRAFT_23265 [Penicilliopsis zonata CBS 506.65]|uniref:Uncharacterized protein n=1 Tax=Penicilliopsis zonata CBS 506.65 TaxID=1073090 RepID=A0A1L9SP58_9EURO|nr:hypothetical protein ASPZODRAFT_23265 [Penicilliopsis zonata CBS 506.65]OJJ48980.1 hypothetical protein ASPZODRAFT_23265 [Penicilliopsis zonata CBS 506.65]